MDASAGDIDKCFFESRLRRLLLHGKKSFLANPSDPVFPIRRCCKSL
jgi:hypothetical protein